MKSKLLDKNGAKTWVLIFDTGEEVASGMGRFAVENRLSACSFTAIGVFQDVVLGVFEWERKDYKRIPIREQVEVLSLVGDVAVENDAEGSRSHSGRKIRWDCPRRAFARSPRQADLEVVITEVPEHLEGNTIWKRDSRSFGPEYE